MQCAGCGRGLLFSERVAHPQQFCRPCSAARGIERLCDLAWAKRIRARADRLQPWWQWTVYLEHALQWPMNIDRHGGG